MAVRILTLFAVLFGTLAIVGAADPALASEQAATVLYSYDEPGVYAIDAHRAGIVGDRSGPRIERLRATKVHAGAVITHDAHLYDAPANTAPQTQRSDAVHSGSRTSIPRLDSDGSAKLSSFSPDVVGAETAAGGEAGADEAFHYTFGKSVSNIEENGLKPGSYATPNGELSPLQAQIDLALPPNRGLTDSVVGVDLAGLRNAGYDVPTPTQVGRSFNMPGGGSEMQFPYRVPPEFLKVLPR